MTEDRITLVNYPNLEIELEFTDEAVMLHTKRCVLTRDTLRLMHKTLDEIKRLCAIHWPVLMTAVPHDRGDLFRLIEHFDFKSIAEDDEFVFYGIALRKD